MKKYTIKEFADLVEVGIEGELERLPQYEEADGWKVYGDDRRDRIDVVCFCEKDGVVEIAAMEFPTPHVKHYRSDWPEYQNG